MAKSTLVIRLSEEEKSTFLSWTRSGTGEQRMSARARIILALADGESNQQVANRLGTRKARVIKWRKRFAQHGLEGLKDAPRSGLPKRYDEETEKRMRAVLEENPPEGFSRWTGKLIANRLGDVSKDQVWRTLKQHGIHLERRRSWCLSTDPEFAQKAADIVGLYLDPPENAVVLCVDEKPGIQALELERAQGWLRLPHGKALTGYNHEYKRHGTTTLFAALEVATGQIQAGHFNRRRRREFLAFMNEVIAAHPDKEVHVILDNLNTHKPKKDGWLSQHKNVHLHYTPTHVSWLNQVEIWFSILTRSALKGASFTSPRQLRDRIDQFIQVHNQNAAPFQWTKKVVHPVGLRRGVL